MSISDHVCECEECLPPPDGLGVHGDTAAAFADGVAAGRAQLATAIRERDEARARCAELERLLARAEETK